MMRLIGRVDTGSRKSNCSIYKYSSSHSCALIHIYTAYLHNISSRLIVVLFVSVVDRVGKKIMIYDLKSDLFYLKQNFKYLNRLNFLKRIICMSLAAFSLALVCVTKLSRVTASCFFTFACCNGIGDAARLT